MIKTDSETNVHLAYIYFCQYLYVLNLSHTGGFVLVRDFKVMILDMKVGCLTWTDTEQIEF